MMNHLTIDDTLITQLRNVMEPIELRDSTGKVLGPFMPGLSSETAKNLARLKEPFDLAEAERVSATEGDGMTTEEVIRYLQSLDPNR